MARYFNPHEREARDIELDEGYFKIAQILIHTSVKLVTYLASACAATGRHFNPHEREARDQEKADQQAAMEILIHTSVKLVTPHGISNLG